MSNLKKQLYDRETNQNISPITDTEAVFTPDGRTAEQRNNEQMQQLESELSGRGSYARASVYPTLNLGIFPTMGDANAKLDEIYTTSDTKYHGRLRLSVNGTTMWIEQYQVNYQQRYWMQIVYGPFAKNANGTALVQDFGKAHIIYRVRNGVADVNWSDYQIEGLNLATINGQSLTEGGDIVVTEQGVLPIDDHLDLTSSNAVSNSVLALAFERLETLIEDVGLTTDLIKIAEVTREVLLLEEEQYTGSDGEIILSLNAYGESTDDPVVILRVPDGSGYKYYPQWDASPYYKADEDIDVNEDYFVIYDNSKVEILHYNTTTGKLVSTYIENQSISPIIQATYWCTSSELGTVNDGDFWYDTTSGKLKKCRDASEGYWEEFGVGVLLVNNPNDNKVYEVDNTRPGTISRFLDEGDLQDINARIDNIDVENKEIYYVKYWGSDTTSQRYRGLNIGDCWYDPSENTIKIKTGADTFTTVTPEVALLYDVLVEEFYIYTQDGVSVYERLLTSKDLNTGGIITSRINERVTASEKKYLGSIYEVNWWQNTQPSNPTVGDYWYNTDSKELYIVDSVSPYRITKINTSTRGSILMRRLDGDTTYDGKVYELDFRGGEMRLLDENDIIDTENRLTNLENNKASVQSVNDEKGQREAADEALQDQIDVLIEDTLPSLSNEVATITTDLRNRIVAPLGALVTNVSVQNVSLASYLSGYYYDLVYDTTTKKLLIRRRPAPGSVTSTIYYQNWNVSGRAPSYEANKASDYNIQPSSEYRTTTAVDAPLKGFYYITNSEDLTIYKWNADAATLVKTGTGEGGGDVDVEIVGNDIIIGNSTIHTKTVNGNTILGEGNVNTEVADTDIYVSNPKYPEYYLTSEQKQNIVYAPDYHLWPVLWYGAEVDNIQDSYDGVTPFRGTVFEPKECIYRPYDAAITNERTTSYTYDDNTHLPNPTYCSWDVVLNVTDNKFYLRVMTSGTIDNPVYSYYSKWQNSDVYNSEDGPYRGTLYVKYGGTGNPYKQEIEPYVDSQGVTHYRYWRDDSIWNVVERISGEKRAVTKIWTGSTWSDSLFDVLTDFSSAINECLSANNGNIIFRPNKIYYFGGASSNSTKEILLDGKSNFEIEGNGACILYRNSISGMRDGSSNYFFALDYCSNGVIRNLTLASIRDNNCGGPSPGTQNRLSSASSNINFIAVGNSNRYISIENIITYGMHSDFYFKNHDNSSFNLHNRDISVKNFKGILTVGNTIRDVNNLLIENYDMLQDGYANSGEHVVYFQGGVGNVRFRNCKIKPSNRYVQHLFSHHGEGSQYYNSLMNCIFEGCEISGISIFGAPFGNQRVQFINSTLKMIFDYGGGANTITQNYTKILGSYGARYDFINCTIYAPGEFMGPGGEKTYMPRFNIDGCTFIRTHKEDNQIDSRTTFFRNDKFNDGSYSLNNTNVYIVRNSNDRINYSIEKLSNDDALALLGISNMIRVPQDQYVEETQTLKILAIGNSFTADALWYLPFIMKNSGINIEIGYLHKNGLNIETAYSEYIIGSGYTFYYINTLGYTRWQKNPGTDAPNTPQKAVQYKDWDIITIQQSSTDSVDDGSFVHIMDLINHIYNDAKPNVSIGWIINHSRQEYDNKTAILDNCKWVCEETPITFVIPYGTAIFDARNNVTMQGIGLGGNLWWSDHIHLQEGLPCYIASLTVAQAIFEKYYPKKSVLGDTINPTDAWARYKFPGDDETQIYEQRHGNAVGLTDENRKFAQRVAIMANKFKFEIKTVI